MSFWRAAPGGVTVWVKVQPKARRPGLFGYVDSATGARLRIAVTEAAEAGRANRAVCDSLAQALDVPGSSVRIAAGATSREKRLTVSGEASLLAERLGAL